MAYGGQKELVDAIRRIAEMAVAGEIRVGDINEKTIESCLYTSHLPQPEPDLVLRTSGEKFSSGFSYGRAHTARSYSWMFSGLNLGRLTL